MLLANRFFYLLLQTLIIIEEEMKKMKLAVVFTALVSAFGFSSCLNDGDSGPQTNVLLVTVNSSMGIPQFIPDRIPGMTLIPSAVDLTKYGISSSARRAIITYTVSEGQTVTSETKRMNIDLLAGSCLEVKPSEISNQPDTFDTKGYTSKIKQFCNVMPIYPYYPYYPTIYAEHGYLTLGFNYAADKVGQFGLEVDKISNDTLYLNFRAKTEGTSNDGVGWQTYDLSRCMEYHEVSPIKDDSIRITVSATATTSTSDTGIVSVTTACKQQ